LGLLGPNEEDRASPDVVDVLGVPAEIGVIAAEDQNVLSVGLARIDRGGPLLVIEVPVACVVAGGAGIGLSGEPSPFGLVVPSSLVVAGPAAVGPVPGVDSVLVRAVGLDASASVCVV